MYVMDRWLIVWSSLPCRKDREKGAILSLAEPLGRYEGSTTCAALAEQTELAALAEQGGRDVRSAFSALSAWPQLLPLRHTSHMRRDGNRFAFTRYRCSGPTPLPRGRRLGVHGLHRWDVLRLDRCGSRLCGAKECAVAVAQKRVS